MGFLSVSLWKSEEAQHVLKWQPCLFFLAVSVLSRAIHFGELVRKANIIAHRFGEVLSLF